MKNLFILFLMIFSVTSFAQKKEKVKTKDGVVTFDKVPWASYTKAGGKFFIGILDGGEDFMSYMFESFGTGRYNSSSGKEITETYFVIEFYDKNLWDELSGEFEADGMTISDMLRLLKKHEVIKEGEFNQEGALEFRKRYSQDVSGRRFLTK